METLNENRAKKTARPIKVIQFGEGNFLRGFVDYMLDIANEKNLFDGDIVLIKPIEYGNLDFFHQQNCRYTVSLRGQINGQEQITNRIITSIADAIDVYREYDRYANLAKLDTLRFVVSNTTEAGIVYDETDCIKLNPPKSYPGKLTKFLYERYLHFQGDISKGLIILPVELIDDNGIKLKEAVNKLTKLWGLEEAFATWLSVACVFCSTLVDRIITGFPKDEAEHMWKDFGYIDHLVVTGEPFALWVIESDKEIEQELLLGKAGLPVIFTDNQKPYKQRKVRILNGAHTAFALASFMAGNDYVLESMQDTDMKEFMIKTIYDEIIPTLNLPKEDLISFAEAAINRFQNPFIKHSLLSISLNSISKWKARCLPSLLDYVEQFAKLPTRLVFSLAALIEFYSGSVIKEGVLIGHRGIEEYPIMDDIEILEFFARNSGDELPKFIVNLLSMEAFWDQDLTKIPNFMEAITEYMTDIRTLGVREAIRKLG
jgi:tagaturonate reductase